ncbi:hypothetical protein [Clostridium perfringens]|uniref:hypothetical protein n=1 Tax=Clostridium perfringens TaxID=1502 RepID=UPI001ABA724A|nr:hypothetical protein [Clostridium perfringens]MBO3312865.1 hypothetical protein [Clostridium perfringens]WEV22597.1 hypothetical protein PL327_02705 [Clostridium perfringens D]
MSEAKVTSTIIETTNLNSTVDVEKDGLKQPVMTISCSLSQNSVANIQTYVTNKQLFLENSEAIVAEVTKFRAKATEVAKPLNCFVL